ncbi:MAG TPA: coenzyme-B sulfoethylthiotransferase subunit gamma [Desulfobacteria bacterium]|nr:coenzyme-B sulfoethylthiotransferase subunit gamma [Desulfobacteria bacterium]
MPQFTPGKSIVGQNRRKFMDPTKKLEKLRDVAEEDVVRLLGHRAVGEAYKSIHPPIEELEEPDCSVREMVKPTPGAAAGDRIRYVQFTDSMFFAPATPRIRPMMWFNRYRGVDPGVLSGRTIVEARERDVEAIAKEYIDNETFDTARTGLRGRTVHGHSVRLDENGVMFDALRRWARNPNGDIKYVKDMVGGAIDKEVVLGMPLPEDELRKRTTTFRNAQGGTWMEEDDPEVADVISEIHWNRTWGGFQPFIARSAIKGDKKDVGAKFKLYTPRGGVE